MGPHSANKRLDSVEARNPQSRHVRRMVCDRSELLEKSRPPDPELVNLIEQALLEGQIVGADADRACLWLQANTAGFHSKRYPNCYPKRKRTR